MVEAAVTDEKPEAAAPSWQVIPVDDPKRDHADSALPEAMIFAGAEALDRCREDLENYVAGETPDWDSGMTAVAVFRAMTSAAPQLSIVLDEAAIMRVLAPRTMRYLELAREMKLSDAVTQHERALAPMRKTARAILELVRAALPAPAAVAPAESKAVAALKDFVDACGGNPPDWLQEAFALAEDAVMEAEVSQQGPALRN